VDRARISSRLLARRLEPRRRRAPKKPAGGRALEHSPNLDGAPDPGEIGWAWVPFEDDPSRGKDRPLLVVGRDGHRLFGLMLSSNADREGQRHWMHLGTGAWDGQRRPSWIRLDRVLDVEEKGVRR